MSIFLILKSRRINDFLKSLKPHETDFPLYVIIDPPPPIADWIISNQACGRYLPTSLRKKITSCSRGELGSLRGGRTAGAAHPSWLLTHTSCDSRSCRPLGHPLGVSPLQPSNVAAPPRPPRAPREWSPVVHRNGQLPLSHRSNRGHFLTHRGSVTSSFRPGGSVSSGDISEGSNLHFSSALLSPVEKNSNHWQSSNHACGVLET